MSMMIVCGAGSMTRSSASVRLSVCSLSHHSSAAAACGGFAAERRAGSRYRSTAPSGSGVSARGRSTALSSKCEQCHVDSWRRNLNAELFDTELWVLESDIWKFNCYALLNRVKQTTEEWTVASGLQSVDCAQSTDVNLFVRLHI